MFHWSIKINIILVLLSGQTCPVDRNLQDHALSLPDVVCSLKEVDRIIGQFFDEIKDILAQLYDIMHHRLSFCYIIGQNS